MKTCIVDGSRVESAAALHAHFAACLELPSHYGGNLDALFDCLGDIHEPARICVFGMREMEHRLGDFTSRLASMLWRAARENPRLHLCICSDHWLYPV